MFWAVLFYSAHKIIWLTSRRRSPLPFRPHSSARRTSPGFGNDTIPSKPFASFTERRQCGVWLRSFPDWVFFSFFTAFPPSHLLLLCSLIVLQKKVSSEKVEDLVKGERIVPLVLDFYATRCGPCALRAPPQKLEMVTPQPLLPLFLAL